jgi:hypothetical protein
MPSEVVLLRVDFFKMAAVSMEMAKMPKNWKTRKCVWQLLRIQIGGFFYFDGKPKWSPYGAACLTPCKYPFPLKSFHFWIFNNLVFCCFSVSEPCGTLSNLTCSYACKLSGSTTSCYCKSGYILDNDLQTCKGNLLTERIKGTNV